MNKKVRTSPTVHALNVAFGGKFFFSEEGNVVFAGKIKKFSDSENLGKMQPQGGTYFWNGSEWIPTQRMGDMSYSFPIEEVKLPEEHEENITIKLPTGELHVFGYKEPFLYFLIDKGKSIKRQMIGY
jgi:hypothetical protein